MTAVLDIGYSPGRITCKREVECGSFEIIEALIPAVIAAEKGLNEPRYATLTNILKATFELLYASSAPGNETI